MFNVYCVIFLLMIRPVNFRPFYYIFIRLKLGHFSYLKKSGQVPKSG